MSSPNPTEEVGWNFASDPNEDDIVHEQDTEELYDQLMRDGTRFRRFPALFPLLRYHLQGLSDVY